MTKNGKKTVVIYGSKYGSAKRYAEWIAEELAADLFEFTEISADEMAEYETIIYGGSLYAVGILGLDLIKKNFDSIKDKKIIVFSVGASPARPEAVDSVRKHNFTEEMMKSVTHFHLRGAFDFSKLSLFHKFLMWLMKMSILRKRPENRTEDEKGLLESFSNPADFKSKEAIRPVIEFAVK